MIEIPQVPLEGRLSHARTSLTSPIFRRGHQGRKPRSPRTRHSHPGTGRWKPSQVAWAAAHTSAPQISDPRQAILALIRLGYSTSKHSKHNPCSGCHPPSLANKIYTNQQGTYVPEPDWLSSPNEHGIMPIKQRGLLDQRPPYPGRGHGPRRQRPASPRLEPQAPGWAVLEERPLPEAASEAGHRLELRSHEISLNQHQQSPPWDQRREPTPRRPPLAPFAL